jgi:tryptophan synthase alpha chain
MTRLDQAFAAIPRSGTPGLVTFTVAGDPDLERSARLLEALPQAGANVLEVGVPFSDPLADGPVIQRASERALRGGTTLARVLESLERHRARIAAPIVLFTYANPVLRIGYDQFAARAAAAGVDGVLVVDLPPEESEGLRATLTPREISQIFLVSPTTSAERVRRAAALGSGFIYAISRLGVTGTRDALSADAHEVVALARSLSSLPVALGFGISTPEQVAAACRVAHAAVVGSAIVRTIESAGDAPDLEERVANQVRSLKGAA